MFFQESQPTLQQLVIGLGTVVLTSILLLYRSSKRKNEEVHDGNDDLVKNPPHVRSYIPYLGSALEMSRGIRKFIAKYSQKLDSPIFTATIAGDHCLFIGDPDHVKMVYRYSTQLDDVTLQTQFSMNVLGIQSAQELHELFDPKNQKLGREQYLKYLFSDAELNKTIGAAQKVLQEQIQKLLASSSSSSMWCSHNLYETVRSCVFQASVGPLLSGYLATEKAAEYFQEFDRGVPLLFGMAPSFLVQKATKARSALLHLISDEQFLEKGSDLMKERAAKNGLSDNNYQRSALGLIFASVGNSIPAIFWTLYHILEDPKSYKAIQMEVDNVVKDKKIDNNDSGDSLSFFTLQELDRMTLLKSAFTEALRVYQGAFTSRDVINDFIFDPKKPGQSKYLIQKGTRIMAFVSTLHHDPQIFKDAETYRYDRFAPTSPAFTKNGTVMPFGGGAHLCPGRKFITYETQAFMAMLLTKLDMRLEKQEGQMMRKPEIDYSSQGVGISHPTYDPMIQIRLRQKNTN